LRNVSVSPDVLDRATMVRGADPTGETVHVLSASSCWQTLECLSAVDRTAAICPEAMKTHVAWKTGTSNGHRDAWCAAVTRRWTIVVWMGNARGQASAALVGAEAAAPLALRLIASLDRSPEEPWPIVNEKRRPVEADRSIPITTLAIVSPVSGQTFLVDPDSPAAEQRVVLKAALKTTRATKAGETHTLWWFVDGQPLGPSDAGAPQWWSPEPGAHEIRVIDSRGHAALSHISVSASATLSPSIPHQ
jgi:penicillin-binding protein 1C